MNTKVQEKKQNLIKPIHCTFTSQSDTDAGIKES